MGQGYVPIMLKPYSLFSFTWWITVGREMQIARSLLLRPHTLSQISSAACSRLASISRSHNLIKSSYDQILHDSSKWRRSMQSFSKLSFADSLPGKEIGLGIFLGLSLGGLCINKLHSMPKYDILAESDKQEKVFLASPREDDMDRNGDSSALIKLVRKLWVPSLLVMTVVVGWEYPLSVIINLFFLLLSSKPAPSSIYLWAEKRRLEQTCRKQGFDRIKAQLNPASLMHVEVHDYVLFCVASATSFSESLTVVGILGDWWVVYSSSSSFTGFKLSSLLDHQ